MVDFFENNVVEAKDIIHIQIVRTNLAIQNILGGLSLVIVTGRGSRLKTQLVHNIANISPQGFTKAREFYSPRYDKPQTPGFPDFRSTIYWNPAIKTSPEGKTKFDFFNADDKGTYKVVIEGINAAGELGREVYRYGVE